MVSFVKADRPRFAKAVYFLLGVGVLAPWNAFITATDFFSAVYPGVHIDRLFTCMYLPFCLVFLIITIVAQPQCYPSQSKTQRHQPLSWQSRCRRCLQQALPYLMPSASARIVIAFAGFSVMMGFMFVSVGSSYPPLPADTPAPPPGWSDTRLPLPWLLALVALVGVLDGICQGAVFGEAAVQTPDCTQAVVCGTASSGVLVCAMRILSRSLGVTALADDEASNDTTATASPGHGVDSSYATHFLSVQASTRVYFAMGLLVNFAGLVCYVRLRQAVAQDGDAGGDHAMRPHVGADSEAPCMQLSVSSKDMAGEVAAEADTGSARSGLRAGGKGGGAPSSEEHASLLAGPAIDGICSPPSPQPHAHDMLRAESYEGTLGLGVFGVEDLVGQGNTDEESTLLLHPHGGLPHGHNKGRPPGDHTHPIWSQLPQIWSHLWPVALTLVVVYTCTLSIFPGFIAEDVHSAELGDWYPITLITAFNVADLGGKFGYGVGGWGVGPGREQGQAAGHRSALRLLAASCVRGVLFVTGFWVADRVQASPWIMGALTSALGLTNGWMTAAALTRGPLMLPPWLAETGENVLVVSLVAGLMSGAFMGWLWLL